MGCRISCQHADPQGDEECIEEGNNNGVSAVIMTSSTPDRRCLATPPAAVVTTPQQESTAVGNNNNIDEESTIIYRESKGLILAEEHHQSWLSRVKELRALKDAPESIRDDKLFIMAAVQKYGGFALQYASPRLQANKDVVMAAVKHHGWILQHVSPDLRNDKEVIMVALQHDGMRLAFASPQLQNDKDVVLTAVNENPDAIKFANEDLKRDVDILIAAGMFDENYNDDHDDDDDSTSSSGSHDDSSSGEDNKNKNEMKKNTNKRKTRRRKQKKIKVALSTRFSLHASSDSEATKFTKLLKQHQYIKSNFKIYAPNAFAKTTCDPNWTDFDHPCRGTQDTCQYNNVLTNNDDDDNNTTGHPTDDCCWRYSFRYQLEDAKATKGFMLQLIEKGEQAATQGEDNNNNNNNKSHPLIRELGKGQKIELDMAQQIQLKVFHVYRPMNIIGYQYQFQDHHIEEIVTAIKTWYDDDCQDVSECVVRIYFIICNFHANRYQKNEV